MHKRILLTGSSGGLGLIMAEFLLREGHFVYLHCHANPGALESLCLTYPNQTKLLKKNLLIDYSYLKTPLLGTDDDNFHLQLSLTFWLGFINPLKFPFKVNI
jgi:NAD(P)-dependent dehydrogenase (short-subunit alcohol dehydrogenase family)